MDEIRKRWMYNGIWQLPLSLAMLAIGFHFDSVEFCSINHVTSVLKAMGFTMILFAKICIGTAFSTFCDQDEIECTTDSIIIIFAVIQFALQIWASIVVLGSVSNWQSNDKSSDYFCEKTPFISLIVIWIIEWVWLGIMVFKLYRKYRNSRKSGVVQDQNNVRISLVENINLNHTYSGNENETAVTSSL